MGYEIRFLGGDIEPVQDREQAMYSLAAKYGASIYNKAVTDKAILFNDEYVLVRPGIEERSSYFHKNKYNSNSNT